MAEPFLGLGVGLAFGVPIDVALSDDIAVGVDVFGALLEAHRPVLRVGDHRFVEGFGFAVVAVALQVAQRHPVQSPAPSGVVVENGEAALGVVGDGFGVGLGAGPLGAQLGDHMVESRCASGGDEPVQRFCAVVFELGEQAASERLICPPSSASRATLEVAAVCAALTVSLPTDNFLATFVTDRPASIICWIPRARWASVRSRLWSLVTIWCTIRSIVSAAVSAAVAGSA